jgi:hypothetical protein
VQVLIAAMLTRMLKSHSSAHQRRTLNRRFRRNEEARLYHWRRHKRFPPRRFEQRA